jgi:hypothetical protein
MRLDSGKMLKDQFGWIDDQLELGDGVVFILVERGGEQI